MSNRATALTAELRALLAKYSDEEIGAAIRSVLGKRPLTSNKQPRSLPASKQLLRLPSTTSAPLKAAKAQRNYEGKLPDSTRLLSNLGARDFNTMTIRELRRIAILAGLKTSPKESRSRLVGKLENLISTRQNSTAAEQKAIRPQLGEYEGWVDMIVRGRSTKKTNLRTTRRTT